MLLFTFHLITPDKEYQVWFGVLFNSNNIRVLEY